MIEIEECGDCFALVQKSAWFQHRAWHKDHELPEPDDRVIIEIERIWDDLADLRGSSLTIRAIRVEKG